MTENAPPNAPPRDPFAGHESLHDSLGLTGSEPRCVELCPICRAADVLRATATPEMREQWRSVQREALVTMKALVDHYLERLEDAAGAEAGPTVEDIPIE